MLFHLKSSRLIEMGWNVIRFMPYQLKDDLDWRLKQIFYKVNRKQI